MLKFIIGITCGAVAHKAFKLRDLDKHSSGYLIKVIVSAGSGLLLNVLTDPFLGYFRNVYIFGQEYTVAQALTKIAGGVTFVNSVASTVCAVILYLALRPALERAGLLPKGEKTLSDLSILIQHCCPHLPDSSYPPAVGAVVFSWTTCHTELLPSRIRSTAPSGTGLLTETEAKSARHTILHDERFLLFIAIFKNSAY